MQLLMYTDYALRALLYVGTHPSEPIAASTIARAYDISVDHVAKATKALTRAELLKSARGAGGGVTLARPAEEIRLGEVVRLFEGNRGLVECLQEGGGHCKISPACKLRRALQKAEEAFFSALDSYTLADLIDNRTQLVRLLGPRSTLR